MDLIRYMGTLSLTMYFLFISRGRKTERVSTWPGLCQGSVVMVSTHMELK